MTAWLEINVRSLLRVVAVPVETKTKANSSSGCVRRIILIFSVIISGRVLEESRYICLVHSFCHIIGFKTDVVPWCYKWTDRLDWNHWMGWIGIIGWIGLESLDGLNGLRAG